ncbi:hypothetical protein [Cetobacterium sp.]
MIPLSDSVFRRIKKKISARTFFKLTRTGIIEHSAGIPEVTTTLDLLQI